MKPARKHRLKSLLILAVSGVAVWILTIVLSDKARPLFNYFRDQPAQEAEPLNLLIAFAVALIILFILRKRFFLGWLISISMALIIFSGASLFVRPEISLLLAVALFLFERFKHSFLSNNLLILVALLAGSITIGLSFPINFLIIVLIFLSVYDIFGVFITRFIPHLAQKAVETNVPLLLLAPDKNVSWLQKPALKNSAALLGAGDIFLPAIFLSAVTFEHSVTISFITFAGALVGVALNSALAVKIKTGIPAMPMLALGLIIAYLIAR
ncbi:MAG: presenilin family intramembrane aspartyl protease [Patescibacteria group bacterium]|nr:hypothetical protein [Patescibacteria group bacterium]MBU2509016.1 hypothetical protein [Patescibacteria group bacterium]